MTSTSPLLFVIVGRNEPLFETEIQKRGTINPSNSDAMARQNYFVLHSALDLVDKAAWNSSQMYLKVVDKVSHYPLVIIWYT
jgi:trafficking protein particle complex subunit 2